MTEARLVTLSVEERAMYRRQAEEHRAAGATSMWVAVEDVLTLLDGLPAAAPAEGLDAILMEHRLCGPIFDGCYSHWAWAHCRADGMAWPCDVDAIRAALARHESAGSET